MKPLLISTVLISLSAVSAQAAGMPGAGFLENWDANANGSVTLAEVLEKRENIFYTFDESGDGVLTSEEYVAFDEARAADQANEARNGGGGHGKAAMGMTLGFNDDDGNGEVTMEEFIGNSEAWFALLDRNVDGVVTSADFGRQ